MSRRRFIFYAVVFIGTIVLGIIYDSGDTGSHLNVRKGDRIRVINDTYAAREPNIHSELRKAIIHEDKIGFLQYLYDEKARPVGAGTEGRVIMGAGGCVEVRFDDDPLRNWYIENDFIEKVK